MELLYSVAFLLSALALKIWWESNQESTKDGFHFKTGLIDISVTTSDNNDEADPEFIEEIRVITTGHQLMEFIDDYGSLSGTENDEVLRKALELGLDPDDWADLYCVAEENSKLETVAISKSGDALE